MGIPRDSADASRRAAIIVVLKGQVKAISHQRQDHGGNIQFAGTYRSIPPAPHQLFVRAIGGRKLQPFTPSGRLPERQSDGATKKHRLPPRAAGWRQH
jgi:hypothetical protein